MIHYFPVHTPWLGSWQKSRRATFPFKVLRSILGKGVDTKAPLPSPSYNTQPCHIEIFISPVSHLSPLLLTIKAIDVLRCFTFNYLFPHKWVIYRDFVKSWTVCMCGCWQGCVQSMMLCKHFILVNKQNYTQISCLFLCFQRTRVLPLADVSLIIEHRSDHWMYVLRFTVLSPRRPWL